MTAWIRKVPIEEATGSLKRLFDSSMRRAGKIFQIVHIQSVNPPVLKASLDLYRAIMHGASPLSRQRREMIATVVSSTNHCHY